MGFRYVGNKTFDFSSKKKDFLPKNDQIWPRTGIFGQFGPGHAGLFSALLVGPLVVVARGLYLARHLFTLLLLCFNIGGYKGVSETWNVVQHEVIKSFLAMVVVWFGSSIFRSFIFEIIMILNILQLMFPKFLLQEMVLWCTK